MIVVAIGLFFVAYKCYCKNKGKGGSEDNEEEEGSDKKIETDKETIDQNKINRTVDEINRKQL